jgi:hypothetical protein
MIFLKARKKLTVRTRNNPVIYLFFFAVRLHGLYMFIANIRDIKSDYVYPFRDDSEVINNKKDLLTIRGRSVMAQLGHA